ncbi:MAG: HAMP domain-containing sensor histidine kinase [Candidatus Binatia bacterium]
MTPPWRALLRGVVILGGAAVTIASLVALRVADWPIYVAYLLVSVVLFLPYVEVLPSVGLPIAEIAATIGFLYIGGLPIVVLSNFSPLLTRCLRSVVPEPWKQRLPQLRTDAPVARRSPLSGDWKGNVATHAGIAAEWASFTLGLAVRWWIVASIAPHPALFSDTGAMLLAEVGGYVCWTLLSTLPIYPDRPRIAFFSRGQVRVAASDVLLILVSALTPFVLLIVYEFRAHGIVGAVGSALSALGLHFLLKRLNERRLTVEEQNRRLENLNRELEHRERLSAIGKMSSVVSHQILQQLGVIGIYADLIRNADAQEDPGPVLQQARGNAAAIQSALGDVNRVLRDLLVFSKDLRLNLYDHRLECVVQECVDDCSAEAAERGVALRAACQDAITVTLDKLKMKQAISNVLRNAIDASPQGGLVTVRAAIRNGRVEIAVTDRGPGLRNRDAIFTPFFTTKEHGTGLGLAIAREFTEAHGGELRAEPADNGIGATFVFSLPSRAA